MHGRRKQQSATSRGRGVSGIAGHCRTAAFQRKKHAIAPATVARIDVGMYEVGVRGHDHRHAHSLLDAQMSAPVSSALAMMYGEVTVGTYDTANIQNAEVQRVLDLVWSIEQAANFDELYHWQRNQRIRM